jgi:hypothetical protein
MPSRFPRLAAALCFAALVLASRAGICARVEGLCRFEVDDSRAGVADSLAETCGERATAIFAQLGALKKAPGRTEPVSIRIVGDPAEIAAASPPGARPPDWSVAIAYPRARLVVLALRGRDGRPVEDLDIELEHELSHIALHDIVKGDRVPRWLSEGIAVLQSERSSLFRRGALTLASLGGRVRSLAALHDYPEGGGSVALAYSEAADFVGFLLHRNGWRGIRVVLRRLARGVPLDEALDAVYGRDLAGLEGEWRAELAKRPTWVAIATGTGALWGVATALFALAYLQARRRKKRRLAEMAEQEIDELWSRET